MAATSAEYLNISALWVGISISKTSKVHDKIISVLFTSDKLHIFAVFPPTTAAVVVVHH